MKKTRLVFAAFLFYAAAFCSCANVKITKIDSESINQLPRVVLGDEQTEKYLPLLRGKRVALFSNQSGIVGDKVILSDGAVLYGGNELYGKSDEASLIPFGCDSGGNNITYGEHILDSLISNGVDVKAIFSAEHGFRGDSDAGLGIDSGVDEKTGVPIFSVYGNSGYKKPSDSQLSVFDTLVVDLQDIGIRYYNYYIALTNLIDACSAAGKNVVVLDRPCPLGFMLDGGMLLPEYRSNVGGLPVPAVYGMTLGELARMINGEGWLSSGRNSCDIKVIPCKNYSHKTKYALVRAPSPNLKSMKAVYLYASTCYFENTIVSEGRGTLYPFAVFGSPYFKSEDNTEFSFVPESMPGAVNPHFLGLVCNGFDLRSKTVDSIISGGINLSYLKKCYKIARKHKMDGNAFFGNPDSRQRYWIDYLSGSDSLRKQIIAGKSETEIKDSWQKDLDAFKKQRKNYLLYSEKELPSNWQIEADFPDWTSSENYAARSSLSFKSYSGQGKIYITPNAECKSFSLYVNNIKVETKKMKGGSTWEADISSIAKNGLNTIQISDVNPPELKNAVHLQIPYPVLLDGTHSQAGISSDSLKLIDSIISSDIENGFTSAQLAVIKDGRLVYSNHWGNIQTYDKNYNKVSAPPVTENTLYDLASVSKMFTANYAVQKLVYSGQLSESTRISDIFGEDFYKDTIKISFPNRKPANDFTLEQIKEWKKNITLRDVLTHTAGFSSFHAYFNDHCDIATGNPCGKDGGNVLFAGSDGTAQTRAETLRQIFRTPLIYEPGTRLVYSDIDFLILCFVVEKITGQGLDEYLRENFWEPLKLTHMTYNPLKNGFSKADCAATEPSGNTSNYTLNFGGMRDDVIQGEVHDGLAYYTMAGISGHAGLFSNARDLAKLAYVMLSGGYGNKRFFSKNLIDVFTAPQSISHADYGLGWWRQGEFQTIKQFGSVSQNEVFGHQGFTGTVVFIDPVNNLVIAYLTNKINTPMVFKKEMSNKFYGNYYQSAMVGFVPQIILMGLNGNTSRAQWKSLLYDMAEDARQTAKKETPSDKNSFYWKAAKSLEELYKKY